PYPEILEQVALKVISQENEPSFSVEVNKTSVLLGNYIQVTFTLKNAGGNQFEAPAFEGFDIVGGPNQSSSFSMMNGVTTQSTSYTYYLKPRDVGNLFVEPAFITVDGQTLETQPIEIIVLENPDGIIEQPQRRSPNRMDMFQFPSDDFFNVPSDEFFNFPTPEDFFNFPQRRRVIPKQKEGENPSDDQPNEEDKKPKKKRKVYKI
ncbi:MAG: BatD family protein, partial [Bacteroidota bacterium]